MPILKRFCTALLICLIVIEGNHFCAQTTDEINNWSPGRYLSQAADNAFQKASLMNAMSELAPASPLSMAGALVAVAQTIALDLHLLAGNAYSLVGGGDDDVLDLDLYLVDEKGEIVVSDSEDDNTPIVDFVPATTGVYSLRLQLVSASAPSSFVTFALLSKTGRTITQANYQQSSNKLIQVGSIINATQGGVKFHDQQNQWCWLALQLQAGERWELSNLRLGPASLYIHAIGDEEAQKLDLYLLDEAGKTIEQDEEEDAKPILEFKAQDEQIYTLRVINSSGRHRGSSLVLLSILSQ